ncbi:MAG: FtsQ-type POTRA domain-containing protein [Nocardioidaceae bacterium]|nr:MAG: FtsQ-type POTRA domain-containing protein [Nocardioidaceae bacterium]
MSKPRSVRDQFPTARTAGRPTARVSRARFGIAPVGCIAGSGSAGELECRQANSSQVFPAPSDASPVVLTATADRRTRHRTCLGCGLACLLLRQAGCRESRDHRQLVGGQTGDPQTRRGADGEPLARVDTSRIAARLQGMKQFAAVEVSRCWPDTLCVSVREREAVAVVETEGSCAGWTSPGSCFATMTPALTAHLFLW